MPRPSHTFASLGAVCASLALAPPAHAQLGAILDGLMRPPPPPYYRPPPPPPVYYAPTYIPAPVYRAPPRQIVRSDPTVAEAQRLLSELGYNPGPVDGAAGPRLTEAIRSFQSDHGQARDGRLGDETMSAIRAAWREHTRTAAKPAPHDDANEVAPATKHFVPVPAADSEDGPVKLR